MGHVLALTWRGLPGVPEYVDVLFEMRRADEVLTNGRFRRIIDLNMARRGIGLVRAGPRRQPPAADSHAFSSRTSVPSPSKHLSHRCLAYSKRFELARRR
jgi:hypothetical protein